MPFLTRAQIIVDALSELGMDMGTSGIDTPPNINKWVTNECDTISRDTWCFFGSASIELTSGLIQYSSPEMLSERSVSAIDSSFNSRPLQVVDSQYLDRYFPQWKTASNPKGFPQFCINGGANMFRLYPAPDTSSLIYNYTDLVIQSDNTKVASAGQRAFVGGDANYTLKVPGGNGFLKGVYVIQSVTGGVAQLNTAIGTVGSTSGSAILSLGGLTMEGYMVPGDIWPLNTDICPIPERTHETLVYAVARRAANWYGPRSPIDSNRLNFINNQYELGKNRLEREMHQFSDATRFGDVYRFPFGGGYY